jgi:hypothetical protein
VLFDLLGQPPATATSLATRNLLRSLTMKVPSGQRVARAMKLPELGPGDLTDLKDLTLHSEPRSGSTSFGKLPLRPTASAWAQWTAASSQR